MKPTIFHKGKIIYWGAVQHILETGTGRKGEHYQVIDVDSGKRHSLIIENTESGTLFNCDCTFQSNPRKMNLEKGRQPLCSHIIAIILYKTGKIKL